MRAIRAVAIVCGLLCWSVFGFAASTLMPARASASGKAAAITLRVTDVSPSTPAITTADEPFTVTVSALNTTAAPITGVSLSASRGSPIMSQSALDAVLAHPKLKGDLAIKGKAQPPVTLAPGVPANLTFRTTTSLVDHVDHGLCLCAAAAIYPLVLTAQSAAGIPLGSAATVVPAFDAKPATMRVAWVWPILDRPHRLSAATVFLDDDLTASVASGGRLDRVLQVPELLPRDQQLTLVLDPDLLDELDVMASGRYTVHAGRTPVAGTGAQAAAAWLVRLRAVLADHPGMQVALTPWGDPDVQALAARGLRWSTTLPPGVAARVADALGGAPTTTTTAVPATSIGVQALSELVRHGVRTLVLPTASVAPRDGASGIPAGVARLSTRRAAVRVALTSAEVERDAGSVVAVSGAGAAALPALVSEVAVRVARQPQVGHPLTITAPRYVDPNPSAAARAITDTTRTAFATSSTLAQLTTPSRAPDRISRLRGAGSVASSLPAAQAAAAADLADDLPTAVSLLGGDTAAPATSDATVARLVTNLPVALQRLESAGWRLDPSAGAAATKSLTSILTKLLSGVRIVRPSSGQYTLASSNSELPVTLQNNLDYTVRVRLAARAENDLPGFRSEATDTTIEAHSKKIVHLTTVLDRSGRIQIEAQLFAPDHRPLGDSIPLTVRSTALGVIGVVITVAAGAILAVALLVRGSRQLLRRRARTAATAARKQARAARTPAKAGR